MFESFLEQANPGPCRVAQYSQQRCCNVCLRNSESWGNFQNESISKEQFSIKTLLSKYTRFCYNAQVRIKDLTLSRQHLCYLGCHSLTFTISKIGQFVFTYISYFQSLMDVQPLWHVDVYKQNMFRRGRNMAENHIPNQNFFFRIHAYQKKFIFFVSTSDFDSRCKQGVSSSWIEFDFGFAIENSRSFKMVICSTHSSSHCSWRDAEHICLTACR